MELAICVKYLLVATDQSLMIAKRAAGYIGLTRIACQAQL